MIVIDASALLEILLQTNRAERLMERVFATSERLHAPHLLDIEVTHVLRRLVLHRECTLKRAEEALEAFTRIAIERHGHQPLIPRIWQLRDALSAYDGAYVALAEGLDAPLLTCDGKIARSQGHFATIELFDAA